MAARIKEITLLKRGDFKTKYFLKPNSFCNCYVNNRVLTDARPEITRILRLN